MKFAILPKSKEGKWAILLNAICILFLLIIYGLQPGRQYSLQPTYISKIPAIIISIILPVLFIGILLGFFFGIRALRSQDRSLASLLSVAVLPIGILAIGASVIIQSKGLFIGFPIKEALTGDEFLATSDETFNFGGRLSESDGWIYYPFENQIHIMKRDGTELESIGETGISSLEVSGNWIYFIAPDGSGLNRIHTDGSGEVELDGDPITIYHLSGDKIFYSKGLSKEENNDLLYENLDDQEREALRGKLGLYSMKTNGTKQKKLIDNAWLLMTDGEWIYYHDAAGDLYRIKSDGTESELILTDSSVFYVSGEWLYSILYKSEGSKQATISRTKVDGTNLTYIGTVHGLLGFWCDDQWFYYTTGYGLDRLKLDGTSAEKLNGIKMDRLIGVAGNWMYIEKYESLWKVKLDGSEGIKLK